MPVELHELVGLRQSAAALHPGDRLTIERDVLIDVCDELLAARQLLARLGADLRAVAAKAPRPR